MSRLRVLDVFNLRLGSTNVRAYADIRLDVGEAEPLQIRVKVVQEEGKAAWVAAPSEKWTDQGGKAHYTALVIWPRAWAEVITDAILEVWRDYPEGLEERPQPKARYGQSGQSGYYDRSHGNGGRR